MLQFRITDVTFADEDGMIARCASTLLLSVLTPSAYLRVLYPAFLSSFALIYAISVFYIHQLYYFSYILKFKIANTLNGLFSIKLNSSI